MDDKESKKQHERGESLDSRKESKVKKKSKKSRKPKETDCGSRREERSEVITGDDSERDLNQLAITHDNQHNFKGSAVENKKKKKPRKDKMEIKNKTNGVDESGEGEGYSSSKREKKGIYEDESKEKDRKNRKKKKSKASNSDKSDSDEKAKEETKDKPAYDVGQWGQASFDSDEQKNKFIRLLGGFKKKGSDIANTSHELKKFNTAAMSKDEEKNLNKKLETQYQQAFDFSRKRKGLGLGYDASQDKNVKKFHIDVEQPSKSIKFE